MRRRSASIGNLVESLNDLAALLFERSDLRAARNAYQEAISLMENHAGVVSRDDELLYRSNYLHLVSEMDERGEAVELSRSLIVSIKSAPHEFRESKEHLAMLHNQVGCNLTALGDLTASEREIRIALELNLQSSGPFNVDRSIYLNNLAAALSAQGSSQGALKALVDAYDISHQLLGGAHRDTRIRIGNLAAVYREIGQVENAQALLDQLLPSKPTLTADQSLLSAMNTRALILRDLCRYDEAIEYFGLILGSQRNIYGDDNSSIALTLHNIAVVKADQGDLRGAIKSVESALRAFESNGLLCYCATAADNLAGYYQELSESDAAIAALRKTLTFLETMHGFSCPQSMSVRYRLGNLIFESGDFRDGLDLLLQELDIASSDCGNDSESVFQSLLNLGEKYYSIDRLQEGVSVHRRALKLAQRLHGDISREAGVCDHRLATCLKEMGRTAEARTLLRLEQKIDKQLALQSNFRNL